jgi:hypothetical protein
MDYVQESVSLGNAQLYRHQCSREKGFGLGFRNREYSRMTGSN